MSEWKDLRQNIVEDLAEDSTFSAALKLVDDAIAQAEEMSPEYAQMRAQDAARLVRAQRLARRAGVLVGEHVWDALMDRIEESICRR